MWQTGPPETGLVCEGFYIPILRAAQAVQLHGAVRASQCEAPESGETACMAPCALSSESVGKGSVKLELARMHYSGRSYSFQTGKAI